MAKIAEVVTLYESNARQIPEMLRAAALGVESETDDDDRTTAMIAVQVTKEGQIEVYGWGDVTTASAIGNLHMAATKLATDRFAYFEEGE